MCFLCCWYCVDREYKELEVNVQDTFQRRVDGLQEQVRLLQQRFVSDDNCKISYFTNHVI